MSAARDCPVHGAWVDDGTTDDCPECVAEGPRVVLNGEVVGGGLAGMLRALPRMLEPDRVVDLPSGELDLASARADLRRARDYLANLGSAEADGHAADLGLVIELLEEAR